MRSFYLLLTLAVSLLSSSAFGASYQLTNGTIVDPIQQRFNNANHSYGGANLEPGAALSNVNLEAAVLVDAVLTSANLTGAILANTIGLRLSSGSALYDANTDFTGSGFDPVSAGWTLVSVPEPGTALLVGLGLAGLAARRR